MSGAAFPGLMTTAYRFKIKGEIMTKKIKERKKVEVFEDNLSALADHVAAVAEMGKMIANSRLTRRAIVLLVKDMTNMTYADIDRVLDALPLLEKKYLK